MWWRKEKDTAVSAKQASPVFTAKVKKIKCAKKIKLDYFQSLRELDGLDAPAYISWRTSLREIFVTLNSLNLRILVGFFFSKS